MFGVVDPEPGRGAVGGLLRPGVDKATGHPGFAAKRFLFPGWSLFFVLGYFETTQTRGSGGGDWAKWRRSWRATRAAAAAGRELRGLGMRQGQGRG